MKKVSVVMATYNGEDYLSEQIDSILSQTYPIYELIIQDDGSTDNTVSIANDYAKRNPAVKVFVNEKNIGLNLNFQTAAMRATGDFVAISDQDDVWYPEKIKRQIETIGSCDVCSTSYDVNLMSGELETRNYRYNIERLLFFSYVCGHTMLCRRDFVQDAGNWQPNMWYDWSLSLHASLGQGLVQVSEPMVWHRHHDREVSQIINRRYAAIGQHSALYPYLHGLEEYRRWVDDANRRTIYTYLLKATADGHSPLAHRFCQLLLKNDLFSILRLCRLCQRYRDKIYFNKPAKGFKGWIRGFFFPMIYSCTVSPSVFYKDCSI